MGKLRYLIVNADDFGIGPEVTRSILELAGRRIITSAALLVNSPFAAEAVDHWKGASKPMELGWHPALTIDSPLAPPEQVPSLVDSSGRFLSLAKLMKHLLRGQVHRKDLLLEFQAQYQRFQELTGEPPLHINAHHHVSLFPIIGKALRGVVAAQRPRPYMRRILEPFPLLLGTAPGRLKRLFLCALGRAEARELDRAGFPGNQWLAGLSCPACIRAGNYLRDWISRIPGEIVELASHPGYMDRTLIGRDSNGHDGQLELRVHINSLLRHDDFLMACKKAGFTLISPAQWLHAAGHSSRNDCAATK